MSEKVVVTGGAGFIGSHLVDRLLDDGDTVVVIDNLASGRLENLAHRKGHARLAVVLADIVDTDTCRPVFDRVDRVFHLGALSDIVPSIQRPTEYFRANVQGTASILELARAAGVKKLVYAGSSSCYGIPDLYPTPEEAPCSPQYPYAVTKWLGEQLALSWDRIYGMPVISTRFFNVYGPRSRTSGAYGAVFGVFLAQKLANRPYTVVGDGTQRRDFTYVSDIVDAVVRAGRSDVHGIALNVGTGDAQSVNRLVALLGGPVVWVPKRPGEPEETRADASKARRLLGWSPQVSFETGVANMLEHIDYWREAPVWTPASIADATREWFDFLGREEEP